MSDIPQDEPDLSCWHISYAQAKIRRIREWAEEQGEEWIEQLASAAWSDIDKVRAINRTLRKQAWGRQRKREE